MNSRPCSLAILVARLGPALDELFQQELVVVVPDPFPVAHGADQAGQVVQQAVAPALLEQLGQVVGPVQPAGRGQVRLVGEPAGHRACRTGRRTRGDRPPS